jgi:uncharacterized protein involved in type VI secretion and phage assembly
VSNNIDPLGLGRVEVRAPAIDSLDTLPWARVAVPLTGPPGAPPHGTYFIPQIGSEVLVAFEQGDPGHPYVVGALWNQGTPPPEEGAAGSAITVSAKDGTITIRCEGDLTIESTGGKLVLKGTTIELN